MPIPGSPNGYEDGNRSVVPVSGVAAVGASIVEQRADPVRRPPCTGTSTGAGRRQRQRPVGPLPCPYRLRRTVTRTVTVRSSRYPALRQSGQASSNSGPIRSGALPAQGHPPVLAVDNASVRLARSHVHTGFAERLQDGARTVPSGRRRSRPVTISCDPFSCRNCRCFRSAPRARSLRRRTFAARNGSPAHDLSPVSRRLRRSAWRGGFAVVGEQKVEFGPRGPHGPPETAVRVDLPPLRAAFPASYAAISTCSRLTFNARHTRSHSHRTFASPRRLKRRKPSTCLIQP